MNLAELLKTKIHKNRLSFFCGAGISFNSGIPIVYNVVSVILRSLGCNEADIDIFFEKEFSFENFIETLNSHEKFNLSEFLNIFEGGIPNNNHLLFSILAKCGKLNQIITTNFDSLIEDALAMESIAYNSLVLEQDFANYNPAHKNINIVKIHGCINNKESIRTTLSKIASNSLVLEREKLLEVFFQTQKADPIIFLGYSFSDHFDINSALKRYSTAENFIIVVQHEPDSEKERVVELKEIKLNSPFQKCNGYKVFIDTNKFIRELWTLYSEDFLTHESKKEWKFIISNEIDKLAIFQKKNMLSIIYRQRGYYQQSLNYSYLAYESLPKNIKIEKKNAVLFNLIVAENELNYGVNFEKLALEFKKNIRKNDFWGKAMLFRLWADYYTSRNLDNAKNSIEKAIEIIEKAKLNTHGDFWDCYNLYANILEELNLFEKAIEIRMNLFKIAKENGEVLCMASSLLGIANYDKDNQKYEEALNKYDNVIELAKLIGNSDLLHAAQTNKAVILIVELGDLEEGTKVFEEISRNIDFYRAKSYHEMTYLYLKANIEVLNKNFNDGIDIYVEIIKKTLIDKRFMDYIFMLHRCIILLFDNLRNYEKISVLGDEFLSLIDKNILTLSLSNLVERDIFYNIGMSYTYLSLNENAIKCFYTALNYDNSNNELDNIRLDNFWINLIKSNLDPKAAATNMGLWQVGADGSY